ncbi:hypothetical protein QL093DRAFT_2487964 [Fusarium oxysporum]|nr:hypothetical protein QL093DRAFT_2487964 [Fusarium oxysporum]
MTDDLDASKVLKIPSWLQLEGSTPSSRPEASFKFLIHLEKSRVPDSEDLLNGCPTIDLDIDTPQPRMRETCIERESKEICWMFSQPEEVLLELVDIITPVEEGLFILCPYVPQIINLIRVSRY